jgi:chaperonin GroES
VFEKIKPLHDRVLVKRVESQETTPAGLFIPDAAKEKAQTCEVVAVGQGKITPEGKVLPVAVKAGDIVFIGKYAGTEAGDKYLIIREDEILGILG